LDLSNVVGRSRDEIDRTVPAKRVEVAAGASASGLAPSFKKSSVP
jgi:hypothetical protein